jgi:pyruvate-ferredoxin/flavodoxin oxidoreductase
MAIAASQKRKMLLRHIKNGLKNGILNEKKELFEEWIKNYSNGTKSKEISLKINEWLLNNKSKIIKNIKNKEDLHTINEIFILRDMFTKPTVWIMGGDGWAYDIGFGGLDHVLASNVDIKVFVYDNQSYANTGFQVF